MAYTTIDDPSAHFQTKIYTGNGGALAVTNDGNSNLQPDLAWFKKRGASESHALFDTNRGIDRFLISSSTAVEQHQPTNGNTDADDIASFDSDGFTFQGGGGAINQSSNTYVAWQWKCNAGTTSTNSDGTVNTTMQLNSTAGFSIIKWTGAGNNTSTAGHGLGAIPDCIIVKNREDAQNWSVAFPKFETSKLMSLNTDAAFSSASGLSSYNSSTFVDGSGGSSEDYIAYCFKPIQGYSKFSKYTGNGNTDGPFVYTGFKPAWLMIKRSDSANSWYLVDGTRGSSNVISAELEANNDGAEATGNVRLDILSNGYKIRTSGAAYNASGGTYVYMAFAENPFVSSEGVPTTAR